MALALATSGCAREMSGAARRDQATTLAAAGHLAAVTLDTGDACRPPLAAFARNGPGGMLTVFIEGDGHAYHNRSTASADPTPDDPVALRLAAYDPTPKVLYLARPGQYLPAEDLAGCDPALWTLARYAPRVLACLGAALDAAKTTLNARRLRLVGYSGGGALAVLLAARRTDVVGIATLAGNLDTAAWTALHHVPPLVESCNPADAAAAVSGISQVHLTGARDRNTPPWLCRRFLDRLPAGADARCLVIDKADHHRGLAESWPGIDAYLPPHEDSWQP
ncbi:alpha/beta fold hydrolase [Solidesulfovibrio sp.]